MPDQTLPNPPPTFPDIPDIPPMPVAETLQAPSPPPPENDVLDIPPMVADSSGPKKKGKTIATILGIFLLVAAVAAGVILVRQRQLFQQKASLAEPCKACVNGQCQTIASPPNCTPSENECSTSSQCLPDCPNTDCNIPSNVSGAVHCKLTNSQESYCCPTNNPLYNGSTCITICTNGQSRDTDCTQVLDGQTCPGKKLEICQNGNWGGNYPCLDIADDCPSTQQDCSEICVTDHPDGGTYCNANGYLCQNYIGDWAKPKSCFASGSCSSPFSYSSGNYCVNTSSHCTPAPGCSSTPDPSCTGGTPTTPPGATPTPQDCGRCSNLPGQENCWVTWTDLNGGCDSDYYNNRVENCPDSRCTGTPTPTPRVTPTPTPTGCPIAPQCLAIKVYKVVSESNWGDPLTPVQLSTLLAGNKIRLAIAGSPATDIDKAKFTINGIETAEITQKGTGIHANEYYYDYVIPPSITSFTVTAKLHSISLGIWF